MTSSSPFLTLVLLLGGILPLAAAPLFSRWADRSESTKAAMDAFVAISLGGIVILHLWPHAFLTAGGWALAGGFAGLLLPFLLHGSLHQHERKIYPGLVGLAFFGLVLHAALDGVALFSPLMGETAPTLEGLAGQHGHSDHSNAALLATAVVLHRLPMGLAIWWLSVPILGRRVGIALLVSIAAATVLGFSVAGRILFDLSTPAVATFEATIAGMLLHVILGHDHGHAHQHYDHAHGHRHDVPWASALGTLAGVTFVVGLSRFHPIEKRFVDELSFGAAFEALAFHIAPWLVLGLLIEVVRRRLDRGQPTPGSLGSVLGTQLLIPAAMTSVGILGLPWALLLVASVVWLAVAAGLTGIRQTQPESKAQERDSENHLSPSRLGLFARLEREFHRGGIWALLGLMTVALLEPMLPSTTSADTTVLAIFLGAVAGALLCRNLLIGTLLAFFFLHLGSPPTAVMAFLYFGATASSLQEWKKTCGHEMRGTVLTAILASAGAIPLLWAAARYAPTSHTNFHGLESLKPCFWQSSTLVILGIALASSLFLHGFRGLLYPIFNPAEFERRGPGEAH